MIDIEASVFVFDLDDTLYLERDFARSGFRALAEHFGESAGGKRFVDRCVELLDQGTRGNIFDLALSSCGIESTPEFISKLVDVYRCHQPEISLCADTARFFEGMPDVHTGIITDGPEQTQLGKVRALELDKEIHHIIATGQWGQDYFKPHPRAYEQIEAVTALSGDNLVYIADNGAKDFVTPRRMGWQTVQILRDGRIHDGSPKGAGYEADVVIESLDEIRPISRL